MSYQRYRLDMQKKNESLNIRLLYVTRACYDADWKSVMHTHTFPEIIYVVSGEGYITIETETFTAKPDDLIIINPNVSHTEYGDGFHQLEYIVLGIEGLSFQFSNSSQSYSLRNFHDCKEEILFYLQHMLREVHNKNEYYQRICHNMLECLLFFLTRQTEDVLTFESPKKALRECQLIEKYLEEHFAENITLQTLSSITNMNKFYLVHIFQEYKGISPISYLILCRIREAVNLLETSDYNISQISSAVGFASQSYFSRVFRKEMGCTPNEYRKSLKP